MSAVYTLAAAALATAAPDGDSWRTSEKDA